jgi:hypothetical protein
MAAPNSTEVVFKQALDKHINLWKSDKRLFSGTSTPADLLQEVNNLDKEYENTRARRYAARFTSVVQGFHSYFAAVDAFVSYYPQTHK